MSELYNVSPEMKLLLLSIQAEADDASAERIRNLARQPVDWEQLVETAVLHNVAPLLYWHAHTMQPSWVPEETLSKLEQRFHSNFQHNLFMTGELVKIVRRFEQHGIPVLAFKGPLLATCYENIGLREFRDLDLLVREEDVHRADKMLGEAGFRPDALDGQPAQPGSLPFARAFDFEISYANESTGVLIDLHWALMPGCFALPAEANGIWNRSVLVNFSGTRIRTFDPEDLLLFLCLHGTKHKWLSLGWICDIAHVLKAYLDFDWDELYRRAAQLKITRALSLGLFLALELLNAQIPGKVKADIGANRKVMRLVQSVYEQLFENRSLHTGAVANSLFLMRSRDTLGDSIRCGLECLFQPTKAEWQSVVLPRSLFSLYYLLRPMRLIRKHAGKKDLIGSGL
jgi:hypothetical protein